VSNSPFLQSIHEHMQVQRYSQRTIHTYIYWIRDYIRFNNLAHPKTLTSENVTQYLTYLACKRNVASATRAIALNSIAFLYNKFLLGRIHERSTLQNQPVCTWLDQLLWHCQQLSTLCRSGSLDSTQS
jgi:site-specific recombinase XerD